MTPNVGDAAIWLSESRAQNRARAVVAYVAGALRGGANAVR